MIELTLNGAPTSLDVPPEMPLLWAIREVAGLTGTKFGCGIGACGACTVHLDGEAVRSCSIPVSSAEGRSVTTIEGLADGEKLHPVQRAWIEEQVPQCGYCQSGMIMAVSALLERNPAASDEEVAAAITNICRCGTYERIRRAVGSVTAPGTAGEAGEGENG
ncbi:MAG: (2Fe-2S)-binding protein [Longimicrobiales bacterium]|nr:(2Fe-2S)-binding protein [Longimicrobiales bacterium]